MISYRDHTDILADAYRAEHVPQFKRGLVWCRECGMCLRVDAFVALRSGWPTHCGATMTVDSPDEQREFQQRSRK